MFTVRGLVPSAEVAYNRLIKLVMFFSPWSTSTLIVLIMSVEHNSYTYLAIRPKL